MDKWQAVRDKRRFAVRRFVERHEKRTGESRSALSARADLAEGTVRNYLAGASQTLSIETCDKLAITAGVTVAEIIGDPVPRKAAPIDEVVLAAAIRVWNEYLEQHDPDFRPVVEPHEQASGIAWCYSTLANAKESEPEQGVKREVNDLIEMMRSLRITKLRG